ncbi:MAG TPA: hypothetical protein VFY29_11110 [Terriglobia bacterium]|nr:hypothetical protein [Terriglobia bacterium]
MRWSGPLLLALLTPVAAPAQTTGLKWAPQVVTIDGQQTTGAYVFTEEGAVQSFVCAAPRPYAVASGEQGWACYDPATRVWLLRSFGPPAAVAAPPSSSDTASAATRESAAPSASQPQYSAPPQQPQEPDVVYVEAPPRVVYVQPPPTVVYVEPPPTIIIVDESRRGDRRREPRDEPAATGVAVAPVYVNRPLYTSQPLYVNPPVPASEPEREDGRGPQR